MLPSHSTKHSVLFRTASTFIFVLLLIATVGANYPNKDNVVLRFFNRLYSVFFDTKGESSSTAPRYQPTIPGYQTTTPRYPTKSPRYQTIYATDSTTSGDPTNPPKP